MLLIPGQATLPDVGVSVSGMVTAMAEFLGSSFMTILGIAAVFIVAQNLKFWLRRLDGNGGYSRNNGGRYRRTYRGRYSRNRGGGSRRNYGGRYGTNSVRYSTNNAGRNPRNS